MDSKIASQIAGTAMELVGDERIKQIREKGYSFDHDDQHGLEELAAAAAFFILPAWINQDICSAYETDGLRVQPLLELIAECAWDGIQRHDSAVLGHETSEALLDVRIETMTKGLALGLAELERLMRIRETQERAD